MIIEGAGLGVRFLGNLLGWGFIGGKIKLEV